MRFLTRPDRGGFYFEDPSDADNAITLSVNQAGGLTVAMCQEQAVDSYNEIFEVSIDLPRDVACGLRDFLITCFPK